MLIALPPQTCEGSGLALVGPTHGPNPLPRSWSCGLDPVPLGHPLARSTDRAPEMTDYRRWAGPAIWQCSARTATTPHPLTPPPYHRGPLYPPSQFRLPARCCRRSLQPTRQPPRDFETRARTPRQLMENFAVDAPARSPNPLDTTRAHLALSCRCWGGQPERITSVAFHVKPRPPCITTSTWFHVEHACGHSAPRVELSTVAVCRLDLGAPSGTIERARFT